MLVCDMVVREKPQKPYHVSVLGVEERKAWVVPFISALMQHARCEHDDAYAGAVHYARDHVVVEPRVASMDKKHHGPHEENRNENETKDLVPHLITTKQTLAL